MKGSKTGYKEPWTRSPRRNPYVWVEGADLEHPQSEAKRTKCGEAVGMKQVKLGC